MNKYSYYKKLIAVKYKDINVMKKLCEQNKYNSTLKFEYAKLLLSSGEDHYDEAKEVLIQLLDTKNKKCPNHFKIFNELKNYFGIYKKNEQTNFS